MFQTSSQCLFDPLLCHKGVYIVQHSVSERCLGPQSAFAAPRCSKFSILKSFLSLLSLVFPFLLFSDFNGTSRRSSLCLGFFGSFMRRNYGSVAFGLQYPVSSRSSNPKPKRGGQMAEKRESRVLDRRRFWLCVLCIARQSLIHQISSKLSTWKGPTLSTSAVLAKLKSFLVTILFFRVRDSTTEIHFSAPGSAVTPLFPAF